LSDEASIVWGYVSGYPRSHAIVLDQVSTNQAAVCGFEPPEPLVWRTAAEWAEDALGGVGDEHDPEDGPLTPDEQDTFLDEMPERRCQRCEQLLRQHGTEH
jgi:hypothetical protein